jgi:hypothetical protein
LTCSFSNIFNELFILYFSASFKAAAKIIIYFSLIQIFLKYFFAKKIVRNG